MKIQFIDLEYSVECDAEFVSVLQVNDARLFSKIVFSLASGETLKALEPYMIFEGETEIKSKERLMLISDLIYLPLRDRAIVTKLYERFNALIFEDEEMRISLEEINNTLIDKLAEVGFQLQGEYDFTLEWDARKYLKTFDFGVCIDSDLLFDKLIGFLEVASDIFPEKLLIFVNLKSFLTENELVAFYQAVISLKIQVLLVESWEDGRMFSQERKISN
ncbi:type II-A CRISPR-associated protein Csn2 [uncultured Bacteroides sp.]|uniref:type II-A CRISPR-associated protein Csn2 n=1 Tax=uncultured Bacteroides sp. TaxID=162156 RepID=UPI002AAC3F74|nr:type II-A CRISPR-associated protein Csn2 [uncultured Bacteroides sp.]